MLPGLTIGGLFALTRRANREMQLEEFRRQTMESRVEQAVLEERAGQERSLARMRELTSAQLSSDLMEQGVSPMALAGRRLDQDSPLTSAYIAQAASMSDRRG